jgi:hypothetical protein
MKNAYTILAGKPEGKKLLDRRHRRWGDILKHVLKNVSRVAQSV